MALATAGAAAWTMRRIAMHGRAQLPRRLWRKWKRYEKENRSFDLSNDQERKEWAQIEGYKKERHGEKPFMFRSQAWYGLLAPVVGSVLMQLLYFAGLGGSVDAGLLFTWIFSNLLLTCAFSCIGAIAMFMFLLRKQRKENTRPSHGGMQAGRQWIDRFISGIVLVFYLSTLVSPAIAPLSAASPDCFKKKLTPEEFIRCYDSDTAYQLHSEAIVPEPIRRIPLNGSARGRRRGRFTWVILHQTHRYPTREGQ